MNGRPPWLPGDDVTRVTVSATARFHGLGPQRLPPRADAQGLIAAVLVEEEDDARTVFRALDKPGRTIYVDVERKQRANLMSIAQQCVRHARVSHAKPNDATVDALDHTVTYLLGEDIENVAACIIGAGNLGFKTALRLAERNVQVFVHDRNRAAVRRAVEATNGILPHYQAHPLLEWRDQQVDLLITAITSVNAVGAAWLKFLRRDALVIDMGINNLDAEFIETANASSLQLIRLDTRASAQHVPLAAPGFFENYFGKGSIDGVPVVSGGIIGRRGQVVVDSFARPTLVLGIANGRGALASFDTLSDEEKGLLARVDNYIRGHKESA